MKNFLYFNILFLFCLTACRQPEIVSYTNADAVYLNLTKTFILNKDGSITRGIEKEQKLLTHRAFQSLYGETRIVYNPAIEKVKLLKVWTIDGSGKKIEVPGNGINEILPAFCENSKAYNHLREYVVTHTGLECNATIHCAYEINSQPSTFPFFQGNEVLVNDCPVNKLTLVVKFPAGTPFHYALLNNNTSPDITRKGEFEVYTWKFRNLPQKLGEGHESEFVPDVPRLLFSNQQGIGEVTGWLKKQTGFSNTALSEEIRQYTTNMLKGKTSDLEKMLCLQEIVTDEINTLRIPFRETGFQVRTPEEVWESNSGTPVEKCCLLSAILNASGFTAQNCFVVPGCFKDEKLPFLLASQPIVKVINSQGEPFLLSAEKLNSDTYQLKSPSDLIITFSPAIEVKNDTTRFSALKIEGNFTLSSGETISGKASGEFSSACVPYFELIRKPETANECLHNFSGKVKILSPGKTGLEFTPEKSKGIISRGDFVFIEIPESTWGVAARRMSPLADGRSSAFEFGWPVDESYHYTLTLPEGFKLLNATETELTYPGTGNITLKISQNGNKIEILRAIRIEKQTIPPEEYPHLKALADKWNTQKYKQLVLGKKHNL